jgi:hypothetical protein
MPARATQFQNNNKHCHGRTRPWLSPVLPGGGTGLSLITSTSHQPKGHAMSHRRIALVTNTSQKLAELVRTAARQSDAKLAEYVRGAVVQRLQSEGHDVAAALQGQD